MTARRAVGLGILAAIFVVLFWLTVSAAGFAVAIGCWCGGLGFAAIIVFAVCLIHE